jgi:toxin ParE1/3/4
VNLGYSQAALADLRRIDDWLTAIDGNLAATALSAIKQRIARLLINPSIGSPLPGGRRKIIERRFGYVILYRHDRQSLNILRIRHEREDWR